MSLLPVAVCVFEYIYTISPLYLLCRTHIIIKYYIINTRRHDGSARVNYTRVLILYNIVVCVCVCVRAVVASPPDGEKRFPATIRSAADDRRVVDYTQTQYRMETGFRRIGKPGRGGGWGQLVGYGGVNASPGIPEFWRKNEKTKRFAL